MGVGKCPMCGQNKDDLTTHHVVEAPPDANGNHRSIQLCQTCHVNHERYVHYLDHNNINIRKN